MRPTSSDVAEQPSKAFDLLNPAVQRWIWQQRWSELRDAQERAIPVVLAGNSDVVISATTASGKTEAAFLPICSALLADETVMPGVQALYISPLKALINDQYGRLDALCEHLDIPVHRWHGDVAGAHKAKVLSDPSGLLLITPESFEALFVLRGPRIPHLFGALRYVVIDEMHTFIGTERGAQLRSLLHRIELAVRRRIPRIGLSATLGDMATAADWLRPTGARRCEIIESDDGSSGIDLELRGYSDRRPDPANNGDAEPGAAEEIAQHLFTTLRGTDNLVFANSRSAVESYSDALAQLCAQARVPNVFPPHHGNLSRELREDVERRLKDRSTPVTALCTSTLEMGIDIGTVTSVVQIGPPPSVSALRQRLGRSGRRGRAQILRMHITQAAIDEKTALLDRLRVGLVQTIAMTELLAESWYEPPDAGGLHLSTLVQQLLSLIAQHGGVQPKDAYVALCSKGPFDAVSSAVFADLLRSLGKRDVIMQASDGLLLLGVAGERIVNHYSFYAAFQSAEEYRLVAEGRVLGTLAVDQTVVVGTLLIFGGARWKVLGVDAAMKTIDLARSSSGRPPLFDGGVAAVHGVVRRRMYALYKGTDVPAYLDGAAQRMLDEARSEFHRWHLDTERLISVDGRTYLFTWAGDRVLDTLATMLTSRGLVVGTEAIAISTSTDVASVADHLTRLAQGSPPDAADLVDHLGDLVIDKWDELIDAPLRHHAHGYHALDVEGAWREVLDGFSRRG
jgi:ATP-dependent helicase Lhr and Lhr-like helicase